MLVILKVKLREVDPNSVHKTHYTLYKKETLLMEPQLDTSIILSPGNRYFYINGITQDLINKKIIVTYLDDFHYRDCWENKHEQAYQEYLAEGWNREIPM